MTRRILTARRNNKEEQTSVSSNRKDYFEANQHRRLPSWQKEQHQPFELPNRGCISPPPDKFSDQSSPSPFDGDTNVASLIYPTAGIRDFPSPKKLHYVDAKNNNSSSRSHRMRFSPSSPVRFTPDTSVETQHELDPEEDGAVQFVPALQADYKKMVRRQAAAAEAASWDAILLDEEKKDPDSPTLHYNQPHINNYNADAGTSALEQLNSRSRVAVGGRIARLASLFTSSRAETNTTNNNLEGLSLSPIPKYNQQQRTAPPPPVSPAQSSGSSAYVGWPGTQDKRGNTVSHQSSYDDSSVSAVGPYPLQRTNATFSSSTLNHNKNVVSNAHDKEIQETAFREMAPGWNVSNRSTETASPFGDDFFASAATPPSRPRRRINVPANRNSSSAPYSSSVREEEEDDIIRHDNGMNANDADESSVGRGGSCDDEDEPNAADYHLAAAIADAKRSAQQENNRNRTSLSAFQYAKSDFSGQQIPLKQISPVSACRKSTFGSCVSSHSNHSVRFRDTFPPDRSDPTSRAQWGGPESSGGHSTSSPEGSSVSKTSSAYFSAKLMKTPTYTASNGIFENIKTTDSNTSKFGRYGDIRSCADTAAVQILRKNNRVAVVPPTQDTLAAKDRTMAPPYRAFNNAEGFRGLLDKTKDVPSLLDAVDSDSMSSSKATSVLSGTGSQQQLRFQQDGISSSRTEKYNPKHNYNQPTHGNRSSPRGILKKKSVDLDAESDIFDDISLSKESDVFDNLSAASPRKSILRANRSQNYPARIAEDDSEGSGDHKRNDADWNTSSEFKLVVLAGGIATIQTSDFDYSKRQTASDYDDQLTSSEVSSNGYTKIPGFHQMIAAGTDKDSSLHGIHGNLGVARGQRNAQTVTRSLVLDDIANNSASEDSGSEDEYDDQSGTSDHEVEGYLSHYYVKPALMKRVLRRYRELSESINSDMSLEDFEREADEHKAFALFEMRSRIMEKDIERGLERRGGSSVVDDIVTTSYYRAAHRIRDAVIVCKAWRDGASISDVIKASLLGRRCERTYFIRRRIRNDEDLNESASTVSGFSSTSSSGKFFWEPVKWHDDTDFMQYRCPSLGARQMRGSEIFTIGDCQSILLKLTNERCMELRRALNDATSRQIEAEEMLKDEGEYFEGEMTEAEVLYLSSMEEVKMISKKLVKAEQAFALVRDRIKKLIAKYESILMKLETNSSTVSFESSYYSDYDSAYWNEIERREAEMWARRARRAEIRAEIAAREAFLARQETRLIQEEKQRELDVLKQKLLEVQSETSTPTFENTAFLARSLVMRRHDGVGNDSAKAVQESKNRINTEKIQDVKQRFRERVAAKKQVQAVQPVVTENAPCSNGFSTRVVTPRARSVNNSAKDLFRSAEEEMFQQMDFYERSLSAVDRTRF